MAFTVADYILKRQSEQRVDTLFGVPAAYCAPLFDAATRHASRRLSQQAISKPATRPMVMHERKGSEPFRSRTASER